MNEEINITDFDKTFTKEEGNEISKRMYNHMKNTLYDISRIVSRTKSPDGEKIKHIKLAINLLKEVECGEAITSKEEREMKIKSISELMFRKWMEQEGIDSEYFELCVSGNKAVLCDRAGGILDLIYDPAEKSVYLKD